jgi:eukaryotic-like serine/threonine-protein kinase
MSARPLRRVGRSEGGTLVYAQGGTPSALELTWFDRDGRTLGTLGEGAVDANLALSPDERQVALALRTGSAGNLDIWTIDVGRNLRNRVTSEPHPERSPVWSPDGTRLVFGGAAQRRDAPEKAVLFRKTITESTPSEILVEAEGTPERPCGPLQCGLTPTDWSFDGQFVLYTFNGSFPATGDIWALPLAGDRKPFPVVHSEFSESLGVFSPDRRWIAYMSNETGQPNVYVQPFLRAGAKYRISPNGGRNPRWRANGRELFYIDADGAMTVVSITAGETLEAGPPQPLFRTGAISLQQMYAVTRDGQRFLVNLRPQNAVTSTPVTVIVNWASTLPK